MTRTLSSICLLGCLTLPLVSNAQVSGGLLGQDTVAYRIPQMSLPFLNFTPDARSAGLGDAGAALGADANAVFWNPAKLVFAEKDQGLALSYTPWLRSIGVDDMYFTFLSGYKKVSKNDVIGLSLMYFDMGTIDFTTILGQPAGSFNSREYALTASYSRRLFQNFSMGVNLRYINSNLSGNYSVNGVSLKPASTAAFDISAFYQNEVRDDITGKGFKWAFGGIISNIGGKVTYGTSDPAPIPTNLKLGTALTLYTDKFNKFNFILDLNKLMVPTPPVYQTVNGVVQYNGINPIIAQGKNPNRPTLSSIFGSFSDAPDGFSEEVKEINIATGIEYWYNEQFAARVGYYHEPRLKGGRQYFTTGLGIRLQQKYGIDFAYLIPVTQGSPLAQTFRISLIIDIDKKAKSAEVDDADDSLE
ncbi:type IX secretion system outer membrane channel protein PorV [Larkinella punicea]|uniref:type IX secretion system outer membrane channel protein PorV n=1 Tax=Larkinella punicea TaxID=2315727 RepID=UPI0010589EFE|nr:type IX secretion system outer membrane channel protein PorV [Larkinella punicea]